MKQMMIGVAVAGLVGVLAHAQETTVGSFVKAPLEAKLVKGAPYSGETVSDFVQTLADGNRIAIHSTGRVYRDSEGRIRREEDRSSGSPAISITDPVAGLAYSLDPDNRIAWRTPALAGTIIMNKIGAAGIEGVAARAEERRAAPTIAGAVAPPGSPGVTTVEINGGRFTVRAPSRGEQRAAEVLPAKVLEGVMVEGKRTTVTIPAGAIGNEQPIVTTTEEWTSPELQVLVFTERKDPRDGDSTYRLVNVSRGDPAASLFQVPSDYTIRETGIRRFERQ